MKKEGIVVPNGVTFVGILSACCHAGLIDVGREVFCSMKVVYGIEEKIEHYGCMVDHLGRGRGTYKRDAMETCRGCYFGIFAGI
jgi:pentatricopeptide repeat protein